MDWRAEMHWYGWDGMGAFGWLGMLLMMLFWFGLIALIIWGVAGLFTRNQQFQVSNGPREDRAMSVLRERYARGKITQEEFQETKKTLQNG
jgi:putative membrane protein